MTDTESKLLSFWNFLFFFDKNPSLFETWEWDWFSRNNLIRNLFKPWRFDLTNKNYKHKLKKKPWRNSLQNINLLVVGHVFLPSQVKTAHLPWKHLFVKWNSVLLWILVHLRKMFLCKWNVNNVMWITFLNHWSVWNHWAK